MRVMVALEDRFFRTQNGNVYSNTVCDYAFWGRYLQVFDEVVVLARVCELAQRQMDRPRANGPKVSFCDLPYYVGPWQYLRAYHKLNIAIERVINTVDAYILRIPGTISTLLWRHLDKYKKPYAVEVIGSSLGSIETAGGNRLMRAILKQICPKNQKKQCQNAIAAAYVSKYYLQRDYPPGCWSTYYSSIDLPADAIVDDRKLEKRFSSLDDAISGQRPFRICHAGTMEVAYKAQDILMEAVSICCNKGFRIELRLLGDGRHSGYFAEKAQQLGIYQNVKFLGMLPSGEPVMNQFDSADMFVLPSTTEGLPRALIEAMARGLPCIGTNVGGIPELLDKEDMVPPADADALASKILSVARDWQRMEKMSRRNIDAAKKYGMGELNRRRVEFYRKLVEETDNCDRKSSSA